MTYQERNRFKREINAAMRDPDRYSLHFIYVSDRTVSIRAVSPCSWRGGDSFMGLCLSRQDPRCFRLDRILKLRLVKSSDIRMPFPIRELEFTEGAMSSTAASV